MTTTTQKNAQAVTGTITPERVAHQVLKTFPLIRPAPNAERYFNGFSFEEAVYNIVPSLAKKDDVFKARFLERAQNTITGLLTAQGIVNRTFNIPDWSLRDAG